MPQESISPPRAFITLPGLISRTHKNPTPAAVHKLRTTIRRVETAISVRGEVDDRKKLLKQLSRMRKAAGHLRDVDVHLDILHGLGARGAGSDFDAVKKYLKRHRQKREKKLTETLEKQLDDGLLKRLKQSSASSSSNAVESSIAVTEIAQELIAKGTPTPAEPALHGFRIACKHLRYSAELAPESRERDVLLAELKKVQDAIGAWHDVITLRAEAEQLVGTASPLVSRLRTLGQARLQEAFRVIPKSIRAVQRTIAAFPLRMASQSESADEHHARVAAA